MPLSPNASETSTGGARSGVSEPEKEPFPNDISFLLGLASDSAPSGEIVTPKIPSPTNDRRTDENMVGKRHVKPDLS